MSILTPPSQSTCPFWSTHDRPRIARLGTILESIVGFNLANTDDLKIREHFEIVLLVGALERLLDCRGGDERELTQRVLNTLVPSIERRASACARLGDSGTDARLRTEASVREVWIRDLYRARHLPAHGRLSGKPRPVWSAKNHLLLGAFAFPLVLKAELQQSRAYVPSGG